MYRLKISAPVLLAAFLFCAALSMACSGLKASNDFKIVNGTWQWKNKPFFSTTAHAVFHKFRHDRQGAIEDLKRMKEAGFTIVEVYWQWFKDYDPATDSFNFKDLDDFTLACKELGLPTFCMLQEHPPQFLIDKYGWNHMSELGEKSTRIDDFYVCYPSYKKEAKRFYMAILEHLKERPEVSENILYWNMGGEYKPWAPIRQERDIHYGYDEQSVQAFRKWLEAKGYTPASVGMRWGAPVKYYNTWDDVWPAVNLKKTDYKDRDLKNWSLAKWDWFEFRQQAACDHMAEVISWIREAGDNRPMIQEYNTVTPGGLLLFLDWSRVGARNGYKGIHLGTGSFDREFDYNSLMYNLCIARGASDPPWQSNEQGGMTAPHWMRKHAWFFIGMGGTGLHFWDWRSRDWGLINDDGTPKDGLAMATRLNAEFEFLGDLFKSSQPMPNRIGVMLLPEEILFCTPYEHMRETTLILRALLEAGAGLETAVVTDDIILNGKAKDYKLIICPGQARMRQEVREKLAEFVKNGGNLWLTPGSGTRDETDREMLITPASPLDRVAGVRTPFAGAIMMNNASSPMNDVFGMFDRGFSESTAEVIAKAGNRPALWMNKYGKGKCFLQAVHMAVLPRSDTPLAKDPDALAFYVRTNSGQVPAGIVKKILDESNIRPYANAFDKNTGKHLPMVLIGIRKANPGYIVILIEGENRSPKAKIQLNAKRLNLSGKWIAYSPQSLEKFAVDKDYSFNVSLSPSEVKILHLVPELQAGKWIAEYKSKNWAAIDAKLPKLPKKKLLPPEEAGSFNPGDLKNVKPKKYGDKWLLIDISKHANRSLVDEGKMENAKAFLGSIGTGDNDLNELPKGLQVFEGVPFDIMDPSVNNTSCMITKTVGRPWLGPLEFKGIPVNDKVRRIHWLYGSGWAPFDLPVGYITYHYSDGSIEQENLVCGYNIANWWGYGGPPKNPKCKLAWSGNTPAAKRNYTTVGLYSYYWENPHPEKVVKSIDISSYGGDACIIVVAITAEK